MLKTEYEMLGIDNMDIYWVYNLAEIKGADSLELNLIRMWEKKME